MSNFYEDTLLKGEFELVQKLQKNKEFAKYVTVRFEDRETGELISVLYTPSDKIYPETYVVDYCLPVFAAENDKRNNFQGTAIITLSEFILSRENRDRKHSTPPDVTWKSNFVPFNNHITHDWFCPGESWDYAKNAGLWLFIMGIGATLNQDEIVCADAPNHINSSAYDYWVRRGRKPVTDIKWPWGLLGEPTIRMEKKRSNEMDKTEVEQGRPTVRMEKKVQNQNEQLKTTVKNIRIFKK